MIKIFIFIVALVLLPGSLFGSDCYDEYSSADTISPMPAVGDVVNIAGQNYRFWYDWSQAGFYYYSQLGVTPNRYQAPDEVLLYWSDFTISSISVYMWLPPADDLCSTGTKGVLYANVLYQVDDTYVPNLAWEPNNPCDLDGASSTCSGIEYVIWDDLDECQYHCQPCDNNYNELADSCGAGVAWYDSTTCSGQCVTCDAYWLDAETSCRDTGGVKDARCEIRNGPDNYFVTDEVICMSAAPDPVAPDVEVPDTPTVEPEPDPVHDDDPSTNDDTDGWLAAIKQNTDSMIEQNNDRDFNLGYLPNVDQNLQNIVTNQGVIDDSIDALGVKLDRIHDAIENSDNQSTLLPSDNTADILGPKLDQLHDDLNDTETFQVEYGEFDATIADVPEMDLTVALDGMTENSSTVQTYVESIGINIVDPDSVVSAEIFGEIISMDMSIYEDMLRLAGNFLLGLTTISAIVMVIRG